jgi:hypothetical protein
MSGTFLYYLKMAATAAVDLWMGVSVGYLTDRFFQDKYLPDAKNNSV